MKLDGDQIECDNIASELECPYRWMAEVIGIRSVSSSAI